MPPDIINPYEGNAQKLYERYQKDYVELCTMAIKAGFPKPKDPVAEVIANIGRELEARCEGEKTKIHEEDSEAWGYKLLEEIGSCCPGDDAANVAEHTFDRTLTIIRDVTGISPTR